MTSLDWYTCASQKIARIPRNASSATYIRCLSATCTASRRNVHGYDHRESTVATATLYASLAPRAACALPSSPTRASLATRCAVLVTLCSTANLNASPQIKISSVIVTSLPLLAYLISTLARGRIFEVRFFAWCGRACARGGAGTTQKEDPGYVISLRSGKKTPITVRAGSDRITISRSPRRGLTKLAIDEAQHSHDEVRSENQTHKRAPDAGDKAQLERMMAPEARTTLTR
ncbi:unnamed protein product [Trichogramma brassicae]|uniref:Uncharacterized protein n=1 Tax=Trichogramma brassicae TaxID=86971 RepID=A0A6H5J0Q7_9HYME|nr:unnamed protein product [Trichogramma brassicae]